LAPVGTAGVDSRRSMPSLSRTRSNCPEVWPVIPEWLEDVDALTVLMQHDIEAETERKGARQRSTLDEMFTGVTEYHPIRDREVS
jgi:hypothetical protein